MISSPEDRARTGLEQWRDTQTDAHMTILRESYTAELRAIADEIAQGRNGTTLPYVDRLRNVADLIDRNIAPSADATSDPS